jgi:hypothetical protein
MNASLSRMERDIEATRTRLYDTIDQIQDKLTLPGIVDEVMGSHGMPRFDTAFDHALSIVRRNPVPVLVLAAGLGWMLQNMGRKRATAKLRVVEPDPWSLPPPVRGAAKVPDPRSTADPESSPIEGGRINTPV